MKKNISGRYSLISILLLCFCVISFSGFLLIDTIYSEIIKQGWISDFKDAKESRTADLAQVIQQDVLNGFYPNIVYKAMRFMDADDINEISITLNDGYVVFSQKKSGVFSSTDVFQISEKIETIPVRGSQPPNPLGTIKASYRLDFIKKKIVEKEKFAIECFILVLLLSSILIYFFSRLISNPLRKLSQITATGSLSEISKYSTSSRIAEINELEKRSRDFALEIIKYQEIMMARERDRVIIEVASQVAHDIRSPLSALEMILSVLDEVIEEKRVIIRNSVNRIRDIANSLIEKNKEILKNSESSVAQSTQNRELMIVLLSASVESLVTEHRLRYRNHIGIDINFNQTAESYGLFAELESVEFKRAISNLVNNAVESLVNFSGKVDINLSPIDQNRIEIKIVDNGKGISKAILAVLGSQGTSFGKEGGSGLGLFQAKKAIEAVGGSLEILSNIGVGTTIVIKLPRQKEPKWFVPKLSLMASANLIVFDDDQSIHQIWKGRLDSNLPDSQYIKILHFSVGGELKRYYGNNFADLDQALFLVDYEIIGSPETGLDLIEELGIQSQSILVTSRYEEPSIRERCERQGIKLIPKSMSGFVPIEVL